MKIVNLSQKDDDWLEWRRNGVTATDAVILLNKSPYKTKWRLWAEKTGYCREVDLSLNPLVRRGVEQEDIARQAFEDKHDDLLLPVCVESVKYPLLRASLDGLSEKHEPVELKCPSEAVWDEVCSEETNSKSYQLYYPQVQHQLLVTEAKKGWLVFFFKGEIKEFQITRDEAMIEKIIDNSKVFWEQVINKTEPETEPETDLYLPQGEEVNNWIAAAEEYRIYDDKIQGLKERMFILQDRQKCHLETMKSLMGEYCHADYCGLMITRYKASGRVDYKKLLSDKASGIKPEDVEKYRDKPSERCRVTVTGSVKPRYVVDKEVLAPLDELPEQVETFYW